jgi:hypothetical protein
MAGNVLVPEQLAVLRHHADHAPGRQRDVLPDATDLGDEGRGETGCVGDALAAPDHRRGHLLEGGHGPVLATGRADHLPP